MEYSLSLISLYKETGKEKSKKYAGLLKEAKTCTSKTKTLMKEIETDTNR